MGLNVTSQPQLQCRYYKRLLLPGINDSLEVGSLQRSTANQSAVDVGLCEEFGGIACLAATAIEDACVVGNGSTVLLGND